MAMGLQKGNRVNKKEKGGGDGNKLKNWGQKNEIGGIGGCGSQYIFGVWN